MISLRSWYALLQCIIQLHPPRVFCIGILQPLCWTNVFLSPVVLLQNVWFYLFFLYFSNVSLIHPKLLLVLWVPPPMFHEHVGCPPLQYWLNYYVPWFNLVLQHIPYSICILEHASSVTHFKVHPLITLNSFKHIPCYLLVHYVPGWNY